MSDDTLRAIAALFFGWLIGQAVGAVLIAVYGERIFNWLDDKFGSLL